MNGIARKQSVSVIFDTSCLSPFTCRSSQVLTRWKSSSENKTMSRIIKEIEIKGKGIPVLFNTRTIPANGRKVIGVCNERGKFKE